MRLTFPAVQILVPAQNQPNSHPTRPSSLPRPVDQVFFSGKKREAEEELSDTEKTSQKVSRTSIEQDSSSRRETESEGEMTRLMAAARDEDMETLNRQLYMTLRSIDPHTFREQQDEQGRTALHHAIENNRLKAAKALLDGGASKTVEDASKHTPITRAAALGNVEALKLLCTSSIDCNPPLYFARPLRRHPLNTAVQHNQFEAASFLLSQGALTNSLEANPDQDLAQTPLMVAARQNNPDMLDLLLSHGADTEFEDEAGNTALTYAAKHYQWASVKKLLNHQASLEPAKKELQQMLVTACDNNDVKQIRFLIKHGIRPEDGADDDIPVLYEALQQAVKTNDLRTAKLLLEGGLNPDSPSEEVQTPAIVLAAENKNPEMVKLLLRFNADIDAQSQSEGSSKGQTALHKAAQNNDEAMIYLLRSGVAHIEIEDEMGRTTLTHAIEKGHNALAKKLCEDCNADLSWDFRSSGTRRTPMLVAAEQGNIEMLDFMLSKEVDPNEGNNVNIAPLMWAKDRQTAQRLIQAGANVDVVDEDELTPLMHHAIQNKTAVMDYLIQQNAQLEEEDEVGDTALFKAAACKHPEAVKLLIRRGANVHHENHSTNTALIETLGYNNGWQPNEEENVAILNALLDAGADINHVNDSNYTALHFAAVNLLPHSTETLLNRGVSRRRLPSVLNMTAATIHDQPGLTDDDLKVLSLLIKASPIHSQNNEALAELLKKYVKRTHLQQAAQTGRNTLSPSRQWEARFSDLKKLLEAGVNAKLAEPSIFRTLQYAASQNQDEKVDFLLQKGVAPDGVYKSSRSALMNAAQLGHTRTAQVLLKHKADPNLCNAFGETPFRLAAQKGCINTMLRLMQAGADPAPHIDHEQDSDDEMDVDDSPYSSFSDSPLAHKSKPYPLLDEEERRDIAVSWPLKLKHPKVKAYVESLFPASLTWNLQTSTR